MPDQENSAETPQPPDDFNDYVAFREAEAEGKEPTTPAAPAEKPAARTATDSGTGVKEQEEDEDEDEGQEDAAAEAQPKRKGGFQRRIDRLTREKRELEARVAALETKPAEDAGTRTSVEPDEPKAPVKGKPTPDQFDVYEEYTEAIVDWKQAERDKRAAAALAEKRAAEAEQTVYTAWSTRAEETKKAHPDYDEVMGAADMEIPQYMKRTILTHPDGPRLAYELAKDTEECARIAAIDDPLAAAVAIGAYATKFTKSEPAPKPKAPVTGAPKPVTPLRNGRPTGTTPDIHDPDLAGDYNEWERARRTQLKDR